MSDGKINSRLDIYVPPFAPKPAVRLEVNGAHSCWLNLTPEQAFDTASALWKAAAEAIMGKGHKPIIGLTSDGKVPIVPGQPINQGSPYTKPVIALGPSHKTRRVSKPRKPVEIVDP